MRLVAGTLLVIGLGGCGREVDTSAIAHRKGPPIYWAGRTVEGYSLTNATSGKNSSSFIYGTCKPPPGLDPGGCAPPIEIQQLPIDTGTLNVSQGCRRVASLLGVPTVEWDTLGFFTGTSHLKVYAKSDAQARRVAGVLRPINGDAAPGAPLPPPAPELVHAIDRACGPSA